MPKGFLTGNPEKKSKEFNKVIIKLGNKIERLNKNIAFYEDNDVCHTCNQEIQSETKEKYITESQSQVDEFTKAVDDAKKLMSTQEDALGKAREIQTHVQAIQNDVFKKQTLIDSYQKTITDAENKITELQMDSGSIDRERGKLDLLNEDLGVMKKKYIDLLSTIEDHDVVVSLLKDSGIKTQIVKKYLPVMNKFIRKYLMTWTSPSTSCWMNSSMSLSLLLSTRTSPMLPSLKDRRVVLTWHSCLPGVKSVS